jgi:hypothetical protein
MRVLHCTIGFCLAVLISTAALAQAPTGTISGAIHDQSGAVVPAA